MSRSIVARQVGHQYSHGTYQRPIDFSLHGPHTQSQSHVSRRSKNLQRFVASLLHTKSIECQPCLKVWKRCCWEGIPPMNPTEKITAITSPRSPRLLPHRHPSPLRQGPQRWPPHLRPFLQRQQPQQINLVLADHRPI